MLDVPDGHLALVRSLIQQRLPHCTATAFGSRVSAWPTRGASKKYSDLDIALWGLQPSDDLALAHLRADFEDSALPWRVDLSDARDWPSPLRDLVLRLGIPLAGQAGHHPQAPEARPAAAQQACHARRQRP